MQKTLQATAIAFGCASVSFLHMNAQTQNTEKKQPNIIFILSDDHAYQAIGAYGNKIAQTPNIDRIANEGALLTTNLVANSISGPSRACLLTGKYSHMNGFKENEKDDFDMNQLLFTDVLKQSGYQTAWIGKMHLGSLPRGLDFWSVLPGQGHYYNPDFICQPNDTVRFDGYVSDVVTDLSLDWIKKRESSKPFFLVIGHKATHRQWLPDLQDLGAYDDINFPLPENFYDNYEGREAASKQDMSIEKTLDLKRDLKVHGDYVNHPSYNRFTDEQKKIFQNYYEDKITREFDDKNLSGKELTEWKFQRYLKDYYAVANSMDRNIGRVLDYLDENNLADNTVIIYTSDQGFYMGEHGWFDKRFIYEESLKTPFVIRYPNVIKAGTRNDNLISNIDWAPTVLDIAGAKIPDEIQGESFLPLLAKPKINTKWRDASYYHYYEFPEPHHVFPHFGIRTERYKIVKFYGGVDNWELYDLKTDPQEMCNLINNPEYKGIVTELKKKLKDQILKYKDYEALEILDKSK
ncbi:sulfatase [Dysgonomonas sp. 520]|uniref:sulfatase family protein n=1 Tax=Dysgonomonas sp. 520 TaxID=2302931 RepID=UPI0013D3F6A1|nr:sulfatase [Dysgonomonas sp. 520]NDW09636.1 DUF4976 domain-containing protein [Dysgonomonas sp. 520]